MFELLDYQSRRLINILKSLTIEYDFMTLEEIQEMNDCSKRTVYSDINYIQEHWGDLFKAKRVNNTFYFKKKSVGNLQVVVRKIFQDCFHFNFLRSLYENPYQTITFYKSINHASQSHILRSINIINEKLKKIDAEIRLTKDSKYYIHAENEMYLRVFMAQAMLDYDFIRNMFEADILEDSRKLTCNIAKEMDVELNEVVINFQAVLLIMSLTREKQGFKEQPDPKKIDTWKSDKKLIDLDFKSSFFKEAEKMMLYSATYTLLKAFGYDLNTTEIEKKVDSLLIEIQKDALKMGISINQKKLKFGILSYLYYTKSYPFKSEEILNRSELYGKRYFQKNPVALKKAKEFNKNFRFWTKKEFDYYINTAVFWTILNDSNVLKISGKRFLILSDYGKEHAIFLRNFIDLYFPGHRYTIKSSFHGIPDDSKKDIETDVYDGIVSTIEFDEMRGKNYILINDYPSGEDLKNMYNMIYQIKNK